MLIDDADDFDEDDKHDARWSKKMKMMVGDENIHLYA